MTYHCPGRQERERGRFASGREPRTVKVHAIIEKTASFICKQGTQMEIVLKTKQKDNPQFEFLNYDNELNPYFKHLVSVMKDGRYVPAAQQPEPIEEDSSHSYLHPSLMSTTQPEPELAPMTSQEFLESIKSKLPAGQIANTSYQILLKNLQRHALPTVTAAAPPPPKPKPDAHPQSDHSGSSSSSTLRHSLPTKVPSHPPPPPSSRPPPPPPSSSSSGPSHSTSTQQLLVQPSTALTESVPLITPPPPDQKPIIDKMADYVARNGPEFEACVKLKNDARFQFLDAQHVHYNYYVYKKDMCIKDLEKQKPLPHPQSAEEEEEAAEEMEETSEEKSMKGDEEEDVQSDVNETSDDLQNSTMTTVAEKMEKKEKLEKMEKKEKKEKKEKLDSLNAKVALTLKGVSFSIKPKEEEVTSLKTRTALLYDSSDNEDDSNSDVDRESQPPPTTTMSRNSSRVSLASTTTSERPTGEVAEKKQAEQKLADKLASAAREKLARESRERQLQAQRKRKAALFINMLKDSNSIPSPSSVPTASAASMADCSAAASSINSPFASSTKSGSATPTALLEQAALDLSSRASAVLPVSASSSSSVPSRARSRSPRRHRKRSVTPPSAYTSSSRRSASKSPSRRHGDRHGDRHSRSKHGSKQKSDGRKSQQKSPTPSSSRSSHKKSSSTKDRESLSSSSKHKKSKKSKSSRRSRRSESWEESDDDVRPSSSKRPRVASSVSKVNPIVVDLTGGSPRAGEDGSKRSSERSSKHTRR